MMPGGRGRGIASALAAGVVVALGLMLSAPRRVDLELGGREPIVLEGVHAAERMYARTARWTDGAAHLEWFGQYGVKPTAIEFEIAPFFGRGADQVEIAVGRRVVRHRLQNDWHVVRVPATSHDAVVVVDVRSEVHQALPDPRPLGVRLDRVSIVNGTRGLSLGAPGAAGAATLLAIGALAWLIGLWLAGPGRWRNTVASACVLGMGASLHLGRAWLTPGGLLLLAGAVALALVIGALLARRQAWARPIVVATAVAMAGIWLANALVTSWYFVDVLRLDAWETVPMVERALAGAFAPADLWAPHNEHRPMTGRIITLAAALWTQWNHWWEFAALQVVAALLVCVLAVWATSLPGRSRVQPIMLVAAAAMLCATTQWENWLRGFSVHILFGIFAPAAALLVLSPLGTAAADVVVPAALGWRRLAIAAAFAAVGQLSFGAGLLTWPLGLLVLALRRDVPRRHLFVWLVAGTVAVLSYLPGLPPSNLSGSSPAPGLLVEGVLVALGMQICYVPAAFDGLGAMASAIVTGAAVAVVGCAAMVLLRWRQDRHGDGAWVFPAALAAYGIGSLALIAFGRVSSGLMAMTASRYLGLSACFWAGLLLLIGLHRDGRSAKARAGVRAVALVAIAAVVVASTGALTYMQGEWTRVRLARVQLLRGDVGAAAVVLYPDPFKLQHRREMLQRRRLSAFRPGSR